MRNLEEFWYGNIEPTEYDTSSCKEYKKLLELICRNEEKLQATMTDEQKDLFEKYADCVQEYQTITDCLIFQNSFKLGARMMLEVMEEYPNIASGTCAPMGCKSCFNSTLILESRNRPITVPIGKQVLIKFKELRFGVREEVVFRSYIVYVRSR